MSGSSLFVSSDQETAEIIVRDSRLQEVAHEFGALHAQLNPGLYEVEWRAVDTSRRQFVALGPGEQKNLRIDLTFSSPVPLEGTFTSREEHRGAVERLGEKLARSHVRRAGQGGLLILARTLDCSSSIGLSEEVDAEWTLKDAQGREVPEFNAALERGADDSWVGGSVLLPQGGYALQVRQAGRRFNRALWVSADWTTGIFVPCDPSGVRFERASVLMTAVSHGFPALDREAHQVARMAEQALAGLREDRVILPSKSMRCLLHEKFVNPMAGLLAAHTLLMRRAPRRELVDEVLGNLEGLIPGHPDLAALVAGASSRFGDDWTGSKPAEYSGVNWPPMLLASYRALLVRDARFPETIAEGSPAELVAPFLLNAGVWTTWSEAGSEILGPGQHTLMRRVVDQLKERAIVTGLELLDRALRTELSIDSVKAIPHLRRIAEKEDFPERAAIMEATKRISRFVSDIRAVSDSDADVATTLATMNAETLSGDLLIPKPLIEAALRIIRYRYAEKEKELSEESEQNS